jgi:ATP-dependent Clp protease ATP-binding subunit ClpC
MKYSKEVEKAIRQSKVIALEMDSKTIRPEHLFIALLNDEKSKAYQILNYIRLNIDAIKVTLKDWSITLQSQLGKFNIKSPSLDFETDKILDIAAAFATKNKSDEVNSEHIFYSILENNNNLVSELFKKTPEIYNDLKIRLNNDDDDISDNNSYLYEDTQEDGLKEKTNKNSKTKLIDQFGTDFTKLAKEGKLDPVVGRKDEIKRISQILSRRKKNNPVLVGEPGCVDGDTIITIRKISNTGTHTKIEIDY